MKTKHIAIVLFAFGSMIGCRAPMIIKTEIKDSIVTNTEVVTKDSAVYVPGDTVLINDTIPCPDFDFHKEVKKGRTTARLSITNGVVNVECNTDSLQLIIQMLRRELIRQENFHSQLKEVPVYVDKPVKYVPNFLLWILIISIGLNVWYNRAVIIKLISHYIKPW